MPSAQASSQLQSHATAMSTHLELQIVAAGGWLAFDRYMQEILYAPNLGYYSNGLQKFGASGDFITAPELGEGFARCLARQCAQALGIVGSDIIEFGAGSGALMVSIIKELNSLSCLPDHYYIIELSASLREMQQAAARSQLGELANRVVWLNELPTQSIRGVILANEVLDAMPVKLFEIDHDLEVSEVGVMKCEARSNLKLANRPLKKRIGDVVRARVGPQKEAEIYRSELGLQAEAWIASLAPVLEQGVILLVDYGFNQSTYYHPDRSTGTLMCHYQHRANDDPLFMPGLQDVTCHVNFTAIADSGVKQGLNLAGYAPQAHFLIALGLLDLPDEEEDLKQQLTRAQEIKKLTMPHEMGELFKVLVLTKNFDAPLIGFENLNHANRLWT